MKPTILAALLSTSALGATMQDVRTSFISDCTAKGTTSGDTNAKAFCTCSFNVMEENLTLAEFREVERLVLERRKPEETPQIQRIWAKLIACKQAPTR